MKISKNRKDNLMTTDNYDYLFYLNYGMFLSVYVISNSKVNVTYGVKCNSERAFRRRLRKISGFVKSGTDFKLKQRHHHYIEWVGKILCYGVTK